MPQKRPIMLGIDPGSRVVGFAALEALKPNPLSPKDWSVIDAGVIRTTSTELSIFERLTLIHEAMFSLILELKPTQVAIERAFQGVNIASGLKLGEARGALICAVGRHDLPLVEFSPAQVKKTVGGSGAATKEQLEAALRSLMGFRRGVLPLDASDAVAIALTGCIHVFSSVVPASSSGRGRTSCRSINSRLIETPR